MLRSVSLIKIMLTLLILSAMVYLTKVGVADFLRLGPCIYVDELGNGAVRLDPDGLDHSRKMLLLARSWDDSNPVIPEYLGQTDFMLAQLVSFSPAMQVNFLRNAIADFDSAIVFRPNSAYLWAARMTAESWLLQIKAQINEPIDKSELKYISMALRRAAVLDPWGPSVLQQIVNVGTLRYMEFPPQDRLIIDEAVMRAKQLGIKI